GDFAIVVANIQADTLLSLSPALAGKVRPGGFLLLSGILKEEARGIESAYCNAGLKPVKTLTEKEWAAVIMKR
ncbi:MAG: 50S ribosomal protein L11 methyltransferase, partial [Deltaproteobacteria bacterium]|nr:50S ribosomal protein L11 methyltransferase [Deltaproteobacteria bacterium]